MYYVCLLCLPEYFADETSRNWRDQAIVFS